MATQRFATTGNRRLRRRQLSELRARQRQLPSILAAEQAAELQQKEEDFRNKQLAEQKRQSIKTTKFREREAEKATGLSAAKFGANVLGRGSLPLLGATNLGQKTGGTTVAPGTKSPGVGGVPSEGRFLQTSPTTSQGFFSGLNVRGGLQGALGGGALGFGAGSLFGGGKKKFIGAGIGAGLGALFGSGALSSTLSNVGSFFGLGSS